MSQLSITPEVCKALDWLGSLSLDCDRLWHLSTTYVLDLCLWPGCVQANGRLHFLD